MSTCPTFFRYEGLYMCKTENTHIRPKLTMAIEMTTFDVIMSHQGTGKFCEKNVILSQIYDGDLLFRASQMLFLILLQKNKIIWRWNRPMLLTREGIINSKGGLASFGTLFHIYAFTLKWGFNLLITSHGYINGLGNVQDFLWGDPCKIFALLPFTHELQLRRWRNVSCW